MSFAYDPYHGQPAVPRSARNVTPSTLSMQSHGSRCLVSRFWNVHGEEFVYEYNPYEHKATIRGDETDWREFDVTENGEVPQLGPLSPEEWLWVAGIHALARHLDRCVLTQEAQA